MLKNQLRTLGPAEAQVVLSLGERQAERVQRSEIVGLLGSETTARTVIESLVRKGWLIRLFRGRYLFMPPEYGPENLGENNPLALASALVSPSYVGWWAAAAHYGFTTQRPSTISVAVLKAPPAREIESHEVRFVTLTERKFFGFRDVPVFGRHACLSTPTKTLVDCVDKPPLAGGPSELARIVYGARRELDPGEMVDQAIKMGSTALVKRLGFLTDITGWGVPEAQRDRLLTSIPPWSRAVFGRATRGPQDIGFVSDWGLIVHLTEADLLADVPHAR